MARTYASISVTRCMDPGWRALTWAQQGVYDYLLAHPKLSLCGVLDVKVNSWGKAAADGPTVTQHVEALEAHNLVRWDRDTDELAIRTFVRHDGVLKNRNLAKGMWSAWTSVESENLRLFLVDNFPVEAFEDRFEPPLMALQNRSRNHSSEPQSGTVDGTTSPASHLHLLPASAASSDSGRPVDEGVFLPGSGWVK